MKRNDASLLGQEGGRCRHDAGFTLIELLVVLSILAALGGLVAPKVIGYLGKAKEQSAATQISNFAAALDLYFLDTGRYPSAQQGLDALLSDDKGLGGWRGPYLAEPDLPRDPWGNDYLYQTGEAGGRPEIVSLGADGRPGGSGADADIGG